MSAELVVRLCVVASLIVGGLCAAWPGHAARSTGAAGTGPQTTLSAR